MRALVEYVLLLAAVAIGFMAGLAYEHYVGAPDFVWWRACEGLGTCLW